MSTPPGAQPLPPGYAKEDNSGQLVAANVVMLVSATVFLGSRLYVRRLTNSARGWDEFILVPSYFLLLGVVISTWLSIPQAGVGKHVAVVIAAKGPSALEKFAKLVYIMEWFYIPSALLPRVSVVFLYLRIFTNRRARLCCWFLLAFLISFSVATLIASQLQCIPLQFIWNKHIHGRCFNQLLWYKLTNFPNVFADTIILLLPVPTIWNLKASRSRRASILVVCLMGSLGLVASSVRTAQFFVRADGVFGDPTYTGTPLFTWTVLESGMYLNAACLVGLRPLLRQVMRVFKRYATIRETKQTAPTAEMRSRHTRPSYISRKHFAEDDDFSTTPVVSHAYGNDVDITASDLYDTGPALELEIPTKAHIRIDRQFEVSTASDS